MSNYRTAKCHIPTKQYNKRDHFYFFQFLIALLMCYRHPGGLSFANPITQAPDTPCAPGSASYVHVSALSIPKFQPKPPAPLANPKNCRVSEMFFLAQRPRVATFSGCRCCHCGRQRQAGILHRTGQKPPGRRGRWVGSSAKKRLKHPISLEPQSFPT